MVDLPLPVSRYILTKSIENQSLTYFHTDSTGRLLDWGGTLAVYNIPDLQTGVEIGKQVVFLEGVTPLSDSPLWLPCIEIGVGRFADVHVFSQEDGVWVVLLDVTPEEAQRRRFQQRVNDLNLLCEKQAQVLAQVPRQIGEDDALLANLLAALDLVLMARLEDGVFRVIGTVPDWLRSFYPHTAAKPEGFRPGEKLLVLENFLVDAEHFWRTQGTQRLKSGPWSESTPAGEEIYLEASAVRVGERKLILIERLDGLYEEKHALIQKAREKSLQYYRLETRLHTLLNRLNVGVFRTTSEGQILEANPAFLRFLGSSTLPRPPACSLQDLCLRPEEGLQLKEQLQRGEPVHEQEIQIRRADGSPLWGVLTTVSSTTLSGETIIDGLVEDMTARKLAEEAREEEARVSAALARVGGEMIALLDTPAILNRLCQLTTEVLGCDSSHTFLRQAEEDVFVPMSGYGDLSEQWETLRTLAIPRSLVANLFARLEHEQAVQVVTAERTEPFVAELQRQYGVTVGLYVALYRGKTVIGCLSAGQRHQEVLFTPQQVRIAKGIAQLASLALENAMLIAQLERANRLKEEFLATISHELRTPLHIIMGYTDLLLEEVFGSLTAEQTDSLQRVDKNARQLFELISTTLDLSRLEGSQLPVEVQEIYFPDLIAEIEAETKGWREKSSLQWVWKVAPDFPPLRTDPVKIKVIVKNLLNNAVKFTEQGTISIDVHPRESGVEICVADTGIGMAQEVLPVIFEPFRQADSSTTRRYGGVGLGLYIVRRLLELLGGTVKVDSEVGLGSTFRVWVPHLPTGT
jgi:PAS domain S-box-containing protein